MNHRVTGSVRADMARLRIFTIYGEIRDLRHEIFKLLFRVDPLGPYVHLGCILVEDFMGYHLPVVGMPVEGH